MQLLLKLFFFTFLISRCFGQSTTVDKKINYYTKKAENYLDRTRTLSGFYAIDNVGIKIFASSADKQNKKPELAASWDSIFYLNKPKEPKPIDSLKLKGYKIAIDAGHTAGNLKEGELEKKYLKFKTTNTEGKSDSIEIAEGMLTFATAQLLKKKLEAAGAEVFMTRTFNGGTAFGVSFDDWLKTSYKSAIDSLFKIGEINTDKKNLYLSSKFPKRDKFRLIFKDIELQKRGELINNYKPDLTVIIHFNVDETNTGWSKPTGKDFNMTFVGGAFMKNDLSSKEKRLEFFRLLISDDLEKSITLSSEVIKSFEKNLAVKTATINDAKYLRESCFATDEKGVFCRNLQLTRFIHSPLVYGETLYQDNIIECSLLNKEKDKTKNLRLQQVAEAYYQGVLNYVSAGPEK